MRCSRTGRLFFFIVPIVIIAVFGLVLSPVSPGVGSAANAARNLVPQNGDPAVTDSLYGAHHPKLLYTDAEIPALRAKIHDGGADDTAYSFIRILLQYIYPGSTYAELTGDYFAIGTIPILGVGSALESPPDAASREKGRGLTMYIAANWEPDDDVFNSALRLRALALGYDMFFEASDASERTGLRDEIRAYMDRMLTDGDYTIWSSRPYVNNYSVMIAASLGLAAICLDEETDSVIVQAALTRADDLTRVWLTHQVDENGSCNEGSLYGSWSLRHLVYYFWARLRYDGFDFSEDPRIRNIEKWFAYELHPDGAGKVNNIQDCQYIESPLPLNTTYFDWAMTMWGSRLSAYIWNHVAGSYGYDAGDESDKAGTVIWNQKLTPQQPAAVLPKSKVWEHRGLYYFRTGWPAAASSKDVLFSFYSGLFEGGHAQEDQNQFTLNAYGAHFAVDHGLGTKSMASEAHNMVFIDGIGQHFAGLSVGTDGELRHYVVNGFADFLQGDATKAYSTYSPLNTRGFPFPTSDWSWGYRHANPVLHAYRSVFAIRDPATPPCFIIIDDIDKDGTPHTYEWRLHTGAENSVDVTTNPIRISKGSSVMDVHVLHPAFSAVEKTVTYFDNEMPDPDSYVLSLGATAVNPLFAVVLFPRDATVAPPVVTTLPTAWGFVTSLAWIGGKTDLLLVNTSGALMNHDFSRAAVAPGLAGGGIRWENSGAAPTSILTDAEFALLRFGGAGVEKYVLSGGSSLAIDGIDFVTIRNGPVTIGFSGTEIDLDRYDADFTLYAPGVSDVFCRGQRIFVVESEGYLTRDPVAGIAENSGPPVDLNVAAYPNPFNPVSTITVDVGKAGMLRAAVYDATGRLVRTLFDGYAAAGMKILRWEGEDDSGTAAASGIYFVRVSAGGVATSAKIALVR
jgi:hypothetical protein